MTSCWQNYICPDKKEDDWDEIVSLTKRVRLEASNRQTAWEQSVFCFGLTAGRPAGFWFPRMKHEVEIVIHHVYPNTYAVPSVAKMPWSVLNLQKWTNQVAWLHDGPSTAVFRSGNSLFPAPAAETDTAQGREETQRVMTSTYQAKSSKATERNWGNMVSHQSEI